MFVFGFGDIIMYDMDNTNNKTAVVDNQAAPIGTSNPVSLPQKEQTPISAKLTSEVSEIIEASEKEPVVPPEVREAGVEQVPDKLTLTDEHKALGIEHAGESTPAHTQLLGTVKLPMSEEEALKTIKTTSNTDSKHWLAVLIEKIYKIIKGLKAVS